MKLLQVEQVHSGYGKVEILHGVTISLERHEIVTIIGPNGSGKSTLLKTIMGYLRVTSGDIFFQDKNCNELTPHEIVKMGLGYVPQLTNVFLTLSVQENLEMGGFTIKSDTVKSKIQGIYTLFPILEERKRNLAATLSGGQRQLLAMARALMLDPVCLIYDEPSAGLDPKASDTVFRSIKEIHDAGTAILIVEQDALRSLGISDRGYVLSMGQNAFEGNAAEILRDKEIRKAYLGG